jgi:hypothetical protein
MIGGDELSDFSFDGDYLSSGTVLIEEGEEDLFDDGVESELVSPCLLDSVVAQDGVPINESRQR